jgi:hypothetical protein
MAAIAIAQSTIPATKYQDGDSIDFRRNERFASGRRKVIVMEYVARVSTLNEPCRW